LLHYHSTAGASVGRRTTCPFLCLAEGFHSRGIVPAAHQGYRTVVIMSCICLRVHTLTCGTKSDSRVRGMNFMPEDCPSGNVFLSPSNAIPAVSQPVSQLTDVSAPHPDAATRMPQDDNSQSTPRATTGVVVRHPDPGPLPCGV
jgi:hypothetical protein